MKIVFFGTSDFGNPILEQLTASEHQILAVVTTPDKPQGRKLETKASPVKEWALRHHLSCYEVDKTSVSGIIPILQEIRADLFVVVSFGVILPKIILELPAYPSLNVHSSLLPRHRGASPIRSALLAGDLTTGVTIMKMSERLDAGDILLKQEVEIAEHEAAPQLEARLALLSGPLLLRALEQLETKRATFEVQREELATYSKKISKSDGIIRWTDSAEEIERRVRAYAGWPGAFALMKGKRMIVHEARAGTVAAAAGSEKPGQVIDADAKSGIWVACGRGALKIERLQPEGKKVMTAHELISGRLIRRGDFLE